ncbi:MAG: hypothetical protein Q9167_006720 [Letrouitia subvulpina]
MPQGRKRAEVAAKPSKARQRKQSAVRVAGKDVATVSYNSPQPQDDATVASGTRRSTRIRAKKSALHPKNGRQLNPQQSHQQAQEPKTSTRSRPGATTVPDFGGDTAPVQPLTERGKLTTPESRESGQISRSSKPKAISRPQRKATTNPSKQSEQDPSSQVQSPRKSTKRGKAKQSGPAAPISSKKTAKGKAKSSDPALGSSPELLPESGRHGRREGSAPLDNHQALSREALEELTLNLGLIGAARDEEPAYNFGTTYADPREEFNYKYGYLPPLDEKTSQIIAAIKDNPASVRRMTRISPDLQGDFKKGLMQRNVETDPSKSVDPRSGEIESLSLRGFLQETDEQKQFCEHLWLQDRDRLSPDSSEAIFQRTLMLSLIARHFLIYEKEVNGEQLLDFSVEELWTCLPMPSRALWNVGPGLDVNEKLLTQPRPDLAVCFKRKAVIKDDLWRCLPDATKELACIENQNLGMSRVFHFLTIEAKNANTSLENPKALYQSLNNASQALNNLYEFFQDAGPTHRQTFFDKIRFFSVVANTQGILIRIHRAIEIPQDTSPFRLVMPDRPEYRLNFEYREFARLTGEDGFRRERVIEIFKKIFKYAVDELSVWICATAKDLLKKLDKNFVDYQARERIGFYRHGQPSPETSRNTPRTSRATSKSARASPLAQRLFNANLSSAAQSIARESTNGQITPKANNSERNSQLSSSSNKRTISQVESESADSEEFKVTRKRSRKARV